MPSDVIHSAEGAANLEDYDAIVVGAGIGGIYALHRFRSQGLKVLGLESADGVGGVWYHNRYPGARVDIDSTDYCYYFSPEIYREWRWSERFATQPELLRYLNFVADRLDIKPLIKFGSSVTAAQWVSETARWEVTTSTGRHFRSRFLVMATGNLSAARKPPFPGLDDYQGEWVQTSHWPDRDVAFAGRRVAVIGTGSSSVQAVPMIAEQAEHLYVFQRSPNFSVPARNGPINAALYDDIKLRVSEVRSELFASIGASNVMKPSPPLSEFNEVAARQRLENQWEAGGHGMAYLFGDQGTNAGTNELIAEFVRGKIRAMVHDQKLAEKLSPRDHPIGSRRLCLDTDYFASFNRPNVTLVDVAADPIERITASGIATRDHAYDVDLIVFALGFHAFTGAWDRIDIRNEKGKHPTDDWKQGPKTLLGLMTEGFPNFFFLTGPGSPSVLANLFLMNEYHADWVADMIAYMDRKGLSTVEPGEEAQSAWTAHVAEVASPMLRRRVTNYMVQRTDDGEEVFIPYIGGFNRYAEQADDIAARDYDGFIMT
jgi:cation diffusion facilitator CzcD-associated flavoprotein CzcO